MVFYILHFTFGSWSLAEAMKTIKTASVKIVWQNIKKVKIQIRIQKGFGHIVKR